ncbi:hypothetical protein A2334_05290 [Candidatus Roizmanbacteria bacterium RIFOXYB2_FULL_38_10]|uniref:Cupin type-2 domain-containing protein n=1 Tax=Candidatus Roizmanbacteria bacterium RIFOXYD1_FULL_38_12 TaxID=1802093 RepID=A0A1F7L0G0_9BACT|nr:MAG: hypothetical protein A3K47_02410 [Candidatus Roizmanbacteria bacterium RIFOXYA2_FULL_38_14]OGK63624.1 MAG: hypothetical protein A3K27_02410 [Candidatus Roizmanbacteria bacterium RIFOXYA1_FULL_37_12]OGK65470.1 MAG: hypothetical protein A3K38_02410 [Candidatus Roizmanbacteria bacterium RIFOXYB1_FULL_40_23]OGK68255.1 MAG: hypothetical protein A2334_05290 [Candidatus Roizmanbacteria bacterium RIFOXYB2_FULL_38_10]OGK69875.1 MAG: hypothetical protein A3K21_02415 [Candidatus Roizmanbacteria ba
MKINEVIEELKKKYPGKPIILNNKTDLTEILCEIEPTDKHTSFSTAIAVIDLTLPHYHKNTVEVYEVLKGSLTLTVNNKKYNLNIGESFTIQPNEIHSARGDETWVKVVARPGWRSGDHFTVTGVPTSTQ